MHCIMYTDGGCKTVSGKHYGGYGFHGYLYTPDVATKGAGHPRGLPTRLGWQRKSEVDKAQAVTLLKYAEGFGTEEGIITNNIAELKGAIEALKYIHEFVGTDQIQQDLLEEFTSKKSNKNKEMPEVNTDLESLVIKTDSEYVVRGYNERLTKWIANDWKTATGDPVKNQKYWKELIEAMALFEKTPPKLEWVRGHAGDAGNERADLMANLAINHALFNDYCAIHGLHTPDGHWKTNHEHNRPLGTQTWYFNTDTQTPAQVVWDKSYALYHLGRNDDDDEQHGKRVNNNTYSVVALHEPDPVLEMIRAAQHQISDPDVRQIAIGRLNNVFSSAVYDRLKQYGQSAIRINRANGNMYELGKSEVARVLRVPLISYRALDELDDLEALLGRYLTGTLQATEAATDITEILYDKTPDRGQTLKKTITVASPTVTADVTHHCQPEPAVQSVNLTVSVDLPTRNVLAKLAETNPVVHAITRRVSDSAFRVVTLITTDHGHALWSGHWTNLTRVR
jgi:ribonuclease HI